MTDNPPTPEEVYDAAVAAALADYKTAIEAARDAHDAATYTVKLTNEQLNTIRLALCFLAQQRGEQVKRVQGVLEALWTQTEQEPGATADLRETRPLKKGSES